MVQVFTAYVLLAVGILSNKYALRFIAPSLFVALRMLCSAGILMLYNRRQLDRLQWSQVYPQAGRLAFIALCTTFIPAQLKAWSLQRMLVTKQTLLGSIDPLITAAMAYAMVGEHLTWRKALGILIGMAGAAIIVGWDVGDEHWHSLYRVSLPEVALLSAIIISRYGWMLVQRLLHKDHYTPVQINTLVQLIAGVTSLGMWGLILVLNQGGLLTSSFDYARVCSSQEGGLLAIAILTTILGGNVWGYTLYTRALKYHSATLVAIAGLTIPVIVCIGAYLLYGEHMTSGMLLGGLTIGLGILVFNSGRRCTLASQK